MVRIEDLPMDQVDRPIDPVRDFVDPSLVRELAESIREQGLLQHILCRLRNGRYEVVWGDRRYLAVALLDLPTIRSEVRELTDEEVLVLRATENDQREDLTPMERARVYGRMRDQLGYPIDKIARSMGRTGVTIKMYLDLLDMEPEFQKAINDKSISLSCAVTLRKIDDPEFRQYYLQSAVENGATREVAQQWVLDYERTKRDKYYAEGGGMPVVDASNEVRPTFVTCAGCHGPVNISEARSYIFCPECQKELRK